MAAVDFGVPKASKTQQQQEGPQQKQQQATQLRTDTLPLSYLLRRGADLSPPTAIGHSGSLAPLASDASPLRKAAGNSSLPRGSKGKNGGSNNSQLAVESFNIFLNQLAMDKEPVAEGVAEDKAPGNWNCKDKGSTDEVGGGASNEASSVVAESESTEAPRRPQWPKKRAGRSVRDRHGRDPQRRSVDARYAFSDQTSVLVRAKMWFNDVANLNDATGFWLNAIRFGLFCAMAWCVHCIVLSFIRLTVDPTLD
mmetsp:Transcript_66920/g.139729  ORF Transcript_66920/g.139729 Transcript_66920/m.139729 type:complete len:253 (-) Transcript_66920:42-800(-)